MFFSVPVPGFGSVFVEAPGADSAVAAVQQFLNRNRIPLEEGASVGIARPVEREQVVEGRLLNNSGVPATLDQPEAAAPATVSQDGGDGARESAARPSSARARLFKFDVPVIGDLFVLADNLEDALAAGRAHLLPFLPNLDEPIAGQLAISRILDPDDLPMDADPNFIIDSTGAIRDDLLAGTGVPEVTSTSSEQADVFVGGPPALVGKVIREDGSISFVRIESPNSSEARSILRSRFGPSARVDTVSLPEFLLRNDPDFLDAVQRSQLGNLDSFVETLELITAPVSSVGSEGLSSEGDATAPPSTDSNLPIDVQTFPFASFQNAVADLGFDPEGALGTTISQRFEALSPAARIGSLTGTVDPIGQAPGALQQFFADRFGDLDLAAETFRDLLAGRTDGDLEAENLLAFQALQNPDIATSRGRGDAGDVFRLARAAAADRFGSFVASRLLPSNARLFRELERQLAQGESGTDFLQFARQQNLLPA